MQTALAQEPLSAPYLLSLYDECAEVGARVKFVCFNDYIDGRIEALPTPDCPFYLCSYGHPMMTERDTVYLMRKDFIPINTHPMLKVRTQVHRTAQQRFLLVEMPEHANAVWKDHQNLKIIVSPPKEEAKPDPKDTEFDVHVGTGYKVDIQRDDKPVLDACRRYGYDPERTVMLEAK